MHKRFMVKRINCNTRFNFKDNVACIGYFDSLHIGHLKLINETIDKANKLGLRSMLICFDPDPVELIKKKKVKHILPYKERIKRIKELGIDDIVLFEFDESLMNMDYRTFINEYLNNMNIKELICGFDFTFGYKAKGNIKSLDRYFDGKLNIVEEVKLYGKKVSTTRIKKEISRNNFKLVGKLLGYDYYLLLKGENCSKKGLKWLVSANIDEIEQVIPNNLNILYKNVEIKDNYLIILSDIKIDKNEEFYLVFKDE